MKQIVIDILENELHEKYPHVLYLLMFDYTRKKRNFYGLPKNIQTGLGQLDYVVGTLTRAIQRQLRDVETLPSVEASIELPEIILNKNEDEKEN